MPCEAARCAVCSVGPVGVGIVGATSLPDRIQDDATSRHAGRKKETDRSRSRLAWGVAGPDNKTAGVDQRSEQQGVPHGENRRRVDNDAVKTIFERLDQFAQMTLGEQFRGIGGDSARWHDR